MATNNDLLSAIRTEGPHCSAASAKTLSTPAAGQPSLARQGSLHSRSRSLPRAARRSRAGSDEAAACARLTTTATAPKLMQRIRSLSKRPSHRPGPRRTGTRLSAAAFSRSGWQLPRASVDMRDRLDRCLCGLNRLAQRGGAAASAPIPPLPTSPDCAADRRPSP